MNGAREPDSAEPVYEGAFLGVTLERWNGREREIVERPDVVAIVAVDDESHLILVRQLRPPARKELLELPAGRIEPGEEALASARRELAEETGLTGGRWRLLRTFWTTPGFCRERVHLYLAEGLARGEPAPDEGEEVEAVRVPVDEIGARLAEIEDAKTLIGLLLFLRDGAARAASSSTAGEGGSTLRPR